jgi:hypothetical protein
MRLPHPRQAGIKTRGGGDGAADRFVKTFTNLDATGFFRDAVTTSGWSWLVVGAVAERQCG